MAKSRTAGFTEQPCPGCGESNRRKSITVCPKCLEAIEMVRQHRENYEKVKADDNLGFVECNVPSGWNHPRFYAMRAREANPSLEKIGKTLREITDVLGVSKGPKVSWGYMNYLENHLHFEPFYNHGGSKFPHLMVEERDSGPKKTVLMPKEVFTLLERLHGEIESAMKIIEQESVEYGKNALLMLNDGHLTMDEFNKK